MFRGVGSEPGRFWKFGDREFDFPHRFLRGFSVWPRCATFQSGNSSRTEEQPAGDSADRRRLGASDGGAGHAFSDSEAHCLLVGIAFKFHPPQQPIREFPAPLRRIEIPRIRRSGQAGQVYVEHFSRHAPQRILELPNLVDPHVFAGNVRNPQRKSELRARLNLDPQQRVLFISARLSPEKGLLEFLGGCALLPADVAERIAILIAGEGPQRAQLEKQIAAMRIPTIRPLGQQSEAAMAELYAAADAFCLPSISDPNPLSVVEALWAGLPVLLSSRVGNSLRR